MRKKKKKKKKQKEQIENHNTFIYEFPLKQTNTYETDLTFYFRRNPFLFIFMKTYHDDDHHHYDYDCCCRYPYYYDDDYHTHPS